MKNITLVEFLEKLGDQEASKLLGINKRTINSWRLRERTPSLKNGKVIVSKTKRHKYGPVTYAGIYE